MNIKGRILMLGLLSVALTTSGCARLKELEKINRQQAATIVSLNNEITRLSDELDLMARQQNELARAKKELESRLSGELANGDLGVAMSDRGLVVTVLDRVLFDPGKSELKTSAEGTLQKVADVLGSQAGGNVVYVEGHTDADPIRMSGWKSNWELSTTRATEVIHYFTDQAGLDPHQFVASGYGEFRPVSENDSSEGKSLNRRVEIVISPSKITDGAASQIANPASDAIATGAADTAFIK